MERGWVPWRHDSGPDEPVLIFDGDCAFCTSTVTWMASRLGSAGRPRVTVTPWQWADLAGLGVTPAEAQREVIWVDGMGRHSGGAAAVADWLVFAGAPYSLLGRVLRLPIVRLIAAGCYRVIARNRHRLPGGSPACAMPPSRP